MAISGKPTSIKKRRRARQYLVQAMYQWDLNETSPIDIELHFQDGMDLSRIDRPYFTECLNGIVNHIELLDQHIKPALDRPIEELNPVELAVLRLATYELVNFDDMPYKVIINEALELTKLFGAIEGYKYVNAVLDVLAKTIRPVESGGAGV